MNIGEGKDIKRETETYEERLLNTENKLRVAGGAGGWAKWVMGIK